MPLKRHQLDPVVPLRTPASLRRREGRGFSAPRGHENGIAHLGQSPPSPMCPAYIKSGVGDVECDTVGRVRRKKILGGVSADFLAGTLTAVIGGSGSGKVVYLASIRSAQMIFDPLLPDDLPQRSLPTYATIQFYHRRNHTIQ